MGPSEHAKYLLIAELYCHYHNERSRSLNITIPLRYHYIARWNPHNKPTTNASSTSTDSTSSLPPHPKTIQENIQPWMLAIRCEAISLVVSATITQDKFIPNIDQGCAVSALPSAIISCLPKDLSVIIITPNMTVNPQRIVANFNSLNINSPLDHHTMEIQPDNIHLTNFECLDYLRRMRYFVPKCPMQDCPTYRMNATLSDFSFVVCSITLTTPLKYSTGCLDL